MIKKPIGSMLSLIESFLPHAKEMISPRMNEKYTTTTSRISGNVCCLSSGVFEIYRSCDNLLIAVAEAPYIMGIANMLLTPGSFTPSEEIYVVAERDAQVLCIAPAKAFSILKDNDLLIDAMRVQAYNMACLLRINIDNINHSAYELVKLNLQEINGLPAEKKSRVNVCNYITKKTGLARSGVSAIILSIKKGGYVHMEKGKLISILKDFPEAY
ncbi:helix-turn-helix domain-containing protein [Scandinavium goeteborgense]|uniref:helix-turn-helix domain-containing protein n=1 Tax=Scandinavium goeteborgense TaxID=1851514 RepID=UPI001446EDBF|nr:helix-turn-helix domain-containing protein [Scandinavium goeteborgense]QKN79838.1 helix-turn-helix domain-containing protein [Scandinavium goeteborgense]